jgi:hypothetical protein
MTGLKEKMGNLILNRLLGVTATSTCSSEYSYTAGSESRHYISTFGIGKFLYLCADKHKHAMLYLKRPVCGFNYALPAN